MKIITNLLILIGLFICSSMAAQITLLEKADKQYELNNFDGAIKSYMMALETAPNKSAIQAKLGDASLKLGKTKEAIEWYEKAAVSADEGILFKLGKAYLLKGKYKEAREIFRKIAAQNAQAAHFLENCEFALAGQPPSMYEVKNIVELNSSSDDYFPSFISNNAVVFLSTRTDMVRKVAKMPVGANQLFVTNFSNSAFGKPEFFNSDLKNIFGEGPLCESGFQAVITQNNFVSGIRPMELPGLELSLKKAILNPDGHWKTTQSLPLGGAGYSNAFASISEDGARMVFSSNRPGGQGGFDLYLCKKEGEVWGTPINLAELNSPGNEITPFFSGKNLFFSSDYLKGLGGYDIFRSEQNNGIYNEIYHLGDQVNSCADDYGFIFDEQNGFGIFSSNREGGKGREDLYIAKRYATDFLITVVDEDAKPLADVKIDLSKCRYANGFTDKAGKFGFQLAGETECAIGFYKAGYIPVAENYRGNKGVEPLSPVITLKKAPVPYFGFVQDEDGLPLEGVMIKATNTASQLKFEAFSDASGKYTLPLEAKNDYLIYFSKAKFINLNVNKKNLSANDLALGTVKLRMTFEDNTVPEKPAGKSVQESDRERFTLQIASVSDKNTDLSPYKSALKDVGEVYMTPGANGTYKIKVGKFTSREEAVKAYEKVQKAGFKPMISTAIAGIPQQEKQAPIELLKPDDTVYSNYALRLCTLSKPENFNGSKIEHLGKISSMKNGNLTIFLLNNFKDLEAAKNALLQVQKNGFKEAFVVEKKDGQLVKIN